MTRMYFATQGWKLPSIRDPKCIVQSVTFLLFFFFFFFFLIYKYKSYFAWLSLCGSILTMDNLCWQKIVVVNSYPWYLLARKQLTIFCNCTVYSGVWNSVFRGFDCCWSSLWQSPIYTGCGSLQLGPLRFNASFLFCYYLAHLEWRNQRFFEGWHLYQPVSVLPLGSLSWVLRLLIDSIFHNWREFANS